MRIETPKWHGCLVTMVFGLHDSTGNSFLVRQAAMIGPIVPSIGVSGDVLDF